MKKDQTTTKNLNLTRKTQQTITNIINNISQQQQ